MLGRTPPLIARSRELHALDPGAHLAFQLIRVKGPAQTYRAQTSGDAVEQLLGDVRMRGQLLGPGGRAWLLPYLAGPLADVGLVSLTMADGAVAELVIRPASEEQAALERAAARSEIAGVGQFESVEARLAHEALERAVRRGHKRGLSRAEVIATYRPKGRRSMSAEGEGVMSADPPGFVRNAPPSDVRTSGHLKEEFLSGSSSHSPKIPEETLTENVQSATPSPPPDVHADVRTSVPGHRPPSPPLPRTPRASIIVEGFPLATDRVAGVVTGGSNGRIGDGTDSTRQRFTERLVELECDEDTLRRMAAMARDGGLYGQDKRRVTDLALLAAAHGEPSLLISWINAAKDSLKTEQAAAEKKRREEEQRRVDLTPRLPPAHPRLGAVADNTVHGGISGDASAPLKARAGPGPSKSFGEMTEEERRSALRGAREKLSSA